MDSCLCDSDCVNGLSPESASPSPGLRLHVVRLEISQIVPSYFHQYLLEDNVIAKYLAYEPIIISIGLQVHWYATKKILEPGAPMNISTI